MQILTSFPTPRITTLNCPTPSLLDCQNPGLSEPPCLCPGSLQHPGVYVKTEPRSMPSMTPPSSEEKSTRPAPGPLRPHSSLTGQSQKVHSTALPQGLCTRYSQMVGCYSPGFPLGSITSFESLPLSLTGIFPDCSLSHSSPSLPCDFSF